MHNMAAKVGGSICAGVLETVGKLTIVRDCSCLVISQRGHPYEGITPDATIG